MQGNGDCGGRWHQMGGDRRDFKVWLPSCHWPRIGGELIHPWGEERVTKYEAYGGGEHSFAWKGAVPAMLVDVSLPLRGSVARKIASVEEGEVWFAARNRLTIQARALNDQWGGERRGAVRLSNPFFRASAT